MHKKDIIRVATFNLLNLHLPNKKYYGRREYSVEDYNYKRVWINNMLDNMRADIVGVQELFHESALRDVLNSNPNYKDAQIAMAQNKEGLPSVGLLSRYPITETETIQQFPEQLEVDGMTIPFATFSRPVLKCKVQVREDLFFIVFVAHLKSKRPMMPNDVDRNDPLELAKGQARSLLLRAAEASALRTLLMKDLQNREHPVIVLGDLNDTHTSVTTRIISGDPPFRHLPLRKKLEIWDTLLYHAKDIKARISYEDTYYTHIHNGHHEALDHILFSEELVQENPKHIGRVGDIKVFNDHLIDETLSDDRIPVWQSDHAQVVASIELLSIEEVARIRG